MEGMLCLNRLFVGGIICVNYRVVNLLKGIFELI